MDEITIRTSQPGWFKVLVDVYKGKKPVLVVDDAGVGLDLSCQNLFEIGSKAKLSSQEWTAVFLNLGLGVVGMWLIRLAIIDPEPTSKLGILLVGGVLCITSGGWQAHAILTNRKPPNVEAGLQGIKISWL